jgi:hypothetical protein
MLWLFGQIWVWLLIAFLLGAAVASVVFTAMNRHHEEPIARYGDVGEYGLAVDETQFIPATAEYDEHYEDPPRASKYLPRPQNEWPPEDIDDTGHREGRLPVPNQQSAWRDKAEEPAWPAAAEENWPR